MTREDAYGRLTKIFQDVFDDKGLSIGDATTAEDIEDWDSLEQINLVVAVEKEFEIKFSIGEVSKFGNVGEMMDIIMQRAAG